jgi:hypothetical protein
MMLKSVKRPPVTSPHLHNLGVVIGIELCVNLIDDDGLMKLTDAMKFNSTFSKIHDSAMQITLIQ